MIEKFKSWWKWDHELEKNSADNPVTALTEQQRRSAGPLLALAFGWGFLVTGLFTGGALGNSLPFWPDIILTSFLGNLANFIVGAIVGYIGYKTACNSGLLYRYVYGNAGAYIPVIFISILTIGWQGIVVGAFGVTWTLALHPGIEAEAIFASSTFLITAILAGIIFTITTYFGVKGLERISIPSVAILVFVGFYAIYLNINQAGGLNAFQELSVVLAGKNPMTSVQAINLVIGSWIVGAVVMPEYTRFAKKGWVAIAIPFIVLIVAQWFLQILGALGVVASSESSLFSAFLGLDLNILINEGLLIGWIGIIGMSLALWTTGDANLYLPVIQTSSILKRPKHVMTVICGILGTILGLGLYQNFIPFITLLASIVPPIIGPVIVEYYLVDSEKFHSGHFDNIKSWSPAAFIAYLVGALSTYYSPQWVMPAITGLLTSMLIYLILRVSSKSKI
jgi:cytosine permease